jgi:hypothetical protein
MNIEENQKLVDDLVMQLYGGLKFVNDIDAIDWLCDLDRLAVDGVDVHSYDIISVFRMKGYSPRRIEFEEIRLDSKESAKRDIISSSLDKIKNNKFDNSVNLICKKYKEKFNL